MINKLHSKDYIFVCTIICGQIYRNVGFLTALLHKVEYLQPKHTSLQTLCKLCHYLQVVNILAWNYPYFVSQMCLWWPYS
jgi:hypothetical protein